MESLGVYLFAGAFRLLALALAGADPFGGSPGGSSALLRYWRGSSALVGFVTAPLRGD